MWHAYQLNPRGFLEDCLRYGKMKFWRTGLPWEAINSCINNDTFQFTPSDRAISGFEKGTQFSWDSLHDSCDTKVLCPMCSHFSSVPWTKWNTKSAWVTEAYEGKQRYRGEAIGCGFADKNFSFQCPCGTVLDHELLRTQKFRKDIEALCFSDAPMPGTLLSIDGKPGKTG